MGSNQDATRNQVREIFIPVTIQSQLNAANGTQPGELRRRAKSRPGLASFVAQAVHEAARRHAGTTLHRSIGSGWRSSKCLQSVQAAARGWQYSPDLARQQSHAGPSFHRALRANRRSGGVWSYRGWSRANRSHPARGLRSAAKTTLRRSISRDLGSLVNRSGNPRTAPNRNLHSTHPVKKLLREGSLFPRPKNLPCRPREIENPFRIPRENRTRIRQSKLFRP